MDQYFNEFLTDGDFAPAIKSIYPSKETLEYYQKKIPVRLLGYWKEYGFSGFSDGLFWIVNPKDYQGILEKFLQKTPIWGRENFYVVARTAFGELYVRGDRSKSTTIINPHLCSILPGDFNQIPPDKEIIDKRIGIFFMTIEKNDVDYRDKNDKYLFKKCLKKYGPLENDEMYTFSPALALGGSADIKNIKKVKILEQLSILCDLDTPLVLPSVSELFGST